MIKKILVAFDGSQESDKAFTLALDIASKYSAQVLVISVARPPEPPIAVEMGAVLEAASEYYAKQAGGLLERAASLGISPRFEVRIGHPAEQIVLLANEEDVDMIVMGHRGGGSFLQRWRLGSIARRVMNYAQCSVVVVR
ncbi:MAG: universal stress protein [Syntrophobacteraceae bacterium]|nr:universal stress protein [Syntrophobacteraceae bacterium]